MSYELFYTSAPRGLRRSSSGFCTVAATEGMPTLLISRLEQLSSYQSYQYYQPAYDPSSQDAPPDPVVYAHWRLANQGRARSILSRVSPAGFDHTGRPNSFAYHLVLESNEQPEAGPAWTLLQPGVMEREWEGEPRYLPAGKVVLGEDSPARPCAAWAAAAGDAGWGGVLAEAFLLDTLRPSYLVCDPAFDPLPLLDEATALIPPRLRWQVSFHTCFSELPAGLQCAWRCVRVGTPAAREAARHAGASLVIDLTRPPGGAPDSRGARMGREGGMFAGVLP
jgi:hypothetical protein